MKNLEHPTYRPSVLRSIKFFAGVLVSSAIIVFGLFAFSVFVFTTVVNIINAIQ